MKKHIILIITVFLFMFILTGCEGGGIIPDNNGDGEEPESVQMTVLVEAYIAPGCSRCAKAEPYLDQLAAEYNREEVILVNLVPWGDTYDIREAYQRYDWYGLDGGIPQITFNGLNDNIKPEESSNYTNYSVIKNRVEAQLAISPAIQLDVSKTSNNLGTEITGTVKNISNSTLTNLVVNGMVFKDMGVKGFHYTVTDIFEDEKVSISSLAPGEEISFTLTINGLVWTVGSELDGVVFVQSVSHPKKIIYQSVFID